MFTGSGPRCGYIGSSGEVRAERVWQDDQTRSLSRGPGGGLAVSSIDPSRVLTGRQPELRSMEALLHGARTGQSQVVVLRGEAGIGKSVLLDHLAEKATGCRVLRAAGVESEMEMAFGGLHQLCASMLNRLDALPAPQAQALSTAFGLSDGRPPDRFLVGLAVLSLMADAAVEAPLVCCVDDAQWLDQVSAQTLAFVARRLLADRVALAFAVREPVETDAFADLPPLTIGRLSDREAGALLDDSINGRLDRHVRDRIVAEARGNPLALLELPRDNLAAGGFGLPDTTPLASRIERSFLGRVQALPADSQRLLLAAAADPLGDVPLLWRTAELLGIGAAAAGPAESADLLTVDSRVRFRHPLVRSATYRAASATERRDAHRALAEATDPATDPDRRAWHRAHATLGFDASLASELERSAGRAQARGGIAAAAAFLQRAAELTPDSAHRGVRAIAAARAMLEAGAPEAAEDLLAAAELSELDQLEQARLLRLRAQIAFAQRHGSDAAPLLLAAAQRLLPLDAVEARDTTLEALGAAIFAGRLEQGLDVLVAACAAPPPGHTPDAKDLLLVGLATRVTQGFAAGAAPSRAALQAFRQDPGDDPEINRWLWLACRVAADLFEHEIWGELAHRAVRLARTDGALSVLPLAASYLAGVHMHAGEYAAAAMLMEESSAITLATDAAPLIATSPMLAAYRGRTSDATLQIELSRDGAAARGQGTALSMIDCAHAVLCNGLGRYEDALDSAQRAVDHDDLSLFAVSLVELVEASARSNRPEVAIASMARLSERTRASGSDWALGLEARSRALLSDDESAAFYYEEAIERLARCDVAPHLARAQLLYGEWLRRAGQRSKARDLLRAAHTTFARIGADAFAERARRELAATGETVRAHGETASETLTAQEAQIAILARDGLTNAEIGAQLFLSPHTVEWHLRKVYTKLGVRSRKQIHTALTGARTAADPTQA
jgi:DNA-binding CsgD family transcriptional regulator